MAYIKMDFLSDNVNTKVKREYIVKDGVLQEGHSLTATNYRLGGSGTAYTPTITYGDGYVDFSLGTSTTTYQGSILIDNEIDFTKYKGIGISVIGGGSASTSATAVIKDRAYYIRVSNQLVDAPSYNKALLSGRITADSTTYTQTNACHAVALFDELTSDAKYAFIFLGAANVLRVTDIWYEYECSENEDTEIDLLHPTVINMTRSVKVNTSFNVATPSKAKYIIVFSESPNSDTMCEIRYDVEKNKYSYSYITSTGETGIFTDVEGDAPYLISEITDTNITFISNYATSASFSFIYAIYC